MTPTTAEVSELFVVGFDGTEPSDALRRFFAAGRPAGVILFGRNVVDTAQAAALTRQLRALWPREAPTPLITVDQEGGPVQRLRAPTCPDVARMPAMRAVGRAADPALTRAVGRIMGAQIAALGFNLDFAPVLDVDSNPANPIIGARAFATTPDEVARHGLALAAGLADAQVLACGKHFPGHGDTSEDSHVAAPSLPHDLARLRAVELVPFEAAARAGIPSLMSAHVLFPALDPTRPATLSPHILPRLLRGELAYDGVVFSDDLDMAAVAERFSPEEMAEGALAATVDVLLPCRDLERAEAVREALVRAVERSAEARQAVVRARARVARLRGAAADHAGRPWAGEIPLAAEARLLLQRLGQA